MHLSCNYSIPAAVFIAESTSFDAGIAQGFTLFHFHTRKVYTTYWLPKPVTRKEVEALPDTIY